MKLNAPIMKYTAADLSLPAGSTEAEHTIPFTHQSLNKTALDDFRLLSGDYWGELRSFLAVAKARSFNRAAQLLSSSPPTVSKEVYRLQDRMRAQLLVSTKAGVKLTERGKVLADHLAKFDQSLFSLSHEMKSEEQNVEGLVRISVTEGLGIVFLMPSIKHLAFERPMIQVDLQDPINFNDLRKNQTDMMIGFAPVVSEDVTCRKLGYLHLIPVASREYIQRKGLPNSDALGEHLFIDTTIYQSASPYWQPWQSMVSRGRVAHYCDSSYIYSMLVKAGLGIGLLATYTLLDPQARPLDLGVHIPLRIYASVLTERLKSKPTKFMFERICDLYGEANPWFADDLRLQPGPTIADEGMEIILNSAWRSP